MKPTLGRIVLVPTDPMRNNGSSTAPAIITRVWNDDMVNLTVMLDTLELHQRRPSSKFVEDFGDSAGTNASLWTWPPRV